MRAVELLSEIVRYEVIVINVDFCERFIVTQKLRYR